MSRKRKPVIFLLGLLAWWIQAATCNMAGAVVFILSDDVPPMISIRVGSAGKSVSLVRFDVAADQIGSGNPIEGNRRIRFELVLIATGANPLTAFLTVNSATPLDNGSGGTIPMTEISWTASDEDIPSGSFLGTTSQPIVNYTSSVRITDEHIFFFNNQDIYDAGTYNGQVTYTWAVP